MENGINEGVEMLCGGIVRQALEDLFERPRTKAPDRIIAKEKWVKEKNAEIEDNRVDALNWLGNSDMMAQLELDPSYIVAQFYEANKGR